MNVKKTLLQKSQFKIISNKYKQENQQNHYKYFIQQEQKQKYMQQILPNPIKTQPPYSIAVTYRKQRRLYSIPVNLNVNELLVSLKRVFDVEENLSVYLYMKRSRRLLSGFTRLSELAGVSSLMTEFNEKDNSPAPGKWNDIMKSHEFKPQEIINCKLFLELTMEAVEFTG